MEQNNSTSEAKSSLRVEKRLLEIRKNRRDVPAKIAVL
jgi:hypothetical protein